MIAYMVFFLLIELGVSGSRSWRPIIDFYTFAKTAFHFCLMLFIFVKMISNFFLDWNVWRSPVIKKRKWFLHFCPYSLYLVGRYLAWSSSFGLSKGSVEQGQVCQIIDFCTLVYATFIYRLMFFIFGRNTPWVVQCWESQGLYLLCWQKMFVHFFVTEVTDWTSTFDYTPSVINWSQYWPRF
jgi:hypothetical protein